MVAFQVDLEVPHRELTAATEAGLAAARDALGAAGSVDAIGRLTSSKSAPARLVRVELKVALREGSPSAALAAERAFVDAFAQALVGRGFEAVRIT